MNLVFPEIQIFYTMPKLKDCYTLNQNSAQYVDRDISFSIATRYGLGGRGIEFRWEGGKCYPYPPTSALGYIEYLVISGVNLPGNGLNHLPLSSAEVKENVKLFPCSPLILDDSL